MPNSHRFDRRRRGGRYSGKLALIFNVLNNLKSAALAFEGDLGRDLGGIADRGVTRYVAKLNVNSPVDPQYQ
jgi:hypothetical protein